MAELETFIWDEKHECMGEDERRELVGKRLVNCVKRTDENAPYYKKKLDRAGISPDDIKGIIKQFDSEHARNVSYTWRNPNYNTEELIRKVKSGEIFI